VGSDGRTPNTYRLGGRTASDCFSHTHKAQTQPGRLEDQEILLSVVSRVEARQVLLGVLQHIEKVRDSECNGVHVIRVN